MVGSSLSSLSEESPVVPQNSPGGWEREKREHLNMAKQLIADTWPEDVRLSLPQRNRLGYPTTASKSRLSPPPVF